MSLSEAEIDRYIKRLFPICRSITGNGNRESLKILQELVPLSIKEVPSGSRVYDWVIPDEWNISDAWIAINGNKIVDFKENNLHVVSYSKPVEGYLTWDELRPHLHIHTNLKDAIPYRTSYYENNWGFCVTSAQFQKMKESKGPFEVTIDSTLKPGSLTYGEYVLPGTSSEEVIISTYICHPSMANDNLSGMLMTAFLAGELSRQSNNKLGYRIVWVPETIGAIVYCALNEEDIKRIRYGLVVTCVAGTGKYGYKQSYDASHSINSVIEEIFEKENIDFQTYPFDIHGSDERQYSSQAFRINVASLTKDKYYEYPYYHTSLDDLKFISSRYLKKSLDLHLQVLNKLDKEPVYKNRFPHCEIMLSKYDLYPKVGGHQLPEYNNLSELDLRLWLLWLCDGNTGLYQIARKLDVPQERIELIAQHLCEKKVLDRIR